MNIKDLLIYILSIGRIGVELKISSFLQLDELYKLIKPCQEIKLIKTSVISIVPDMDMDKFNLVSVDAVVTPAPYDFIRNHLLVNVVSLTMLNNDFSDIIVEYLFMTDKIL